MPFDQLAYQAEYNKMYDEDIIRHLETKPSKQGYIKALIRADIKRGEE